MRFVKHLIPYRIKDKLFPKLINSSEYTKHLKQKGVEIGVGTFFFSPSTTIIDTQRPWMLKIGKYCKITHGSTILCHDYSRSVLRMKYSEIIGEAAKTQIGDNVFIGVNSTILMGSKIGNNVIIAANSVVSGIIPDDSVIAGNPAKVIRSLIEHYEIRKKKYIQEAKLYAKNFYLKYNKMPSIVEMNAFFPLFLPREEGILKKEKIWTNWNGDIENEIIESFYNTRPIYNSFNDFINDVFEKKN